MAAARLIPAAWSDGPTRAGLGPGPANRSSCWLDRRRRAVQPDRRHRDCRRRVSALNPPGTAIEPSPADAAFAGRPIRAPLVTHRRPARPSIPGTVHADEGPAAGP